jgi:dTDP-4-dehydrorhamnose 3,5-epimerase
MTFEPTDIKDVWLFRPRVFEDSRGHFFESYNEMVFHAQGILDKFVQDNQSSSVYGVIRGLHYQLPPFAQSKLVRVLRGKILDVVVDIRKDSPTYGKVYSQILSAKNKKQLYVPHGCAHGFSVLSKKAEVLYKCDSFYNKESEGGIRFDDPSLAIDWKIPSGEEIVSDKDKELPLFKESKSSFVYKSR